MTNDDRDSVNSNIEGLGLYCAMEWARKQLSADIIPAPRKRRMLVLTIRECGRRLNADVARARRLAAAHTIGMRTLGIKVALLLAVASFASAQSVVYTNVVNGQRIDEIVKVMRVTTPAAPVPPSIVTTEVLPRNYKTPLGATSYVPPVRSNWGETRVQRPTPVPQPWFINGIYAGQSPSGNWTSTVIGRPIIDVHIVSTPGRKQ